MVLTLLQDPHVYKLDNKGGSPGTTLLVTDTGAADHMLPNKSLFISYYPVIGWQVRMGNNSFAPFHGYGSAIISLNGKKILIRDCLHVSDLRNPLYSLRTHQRQRGCSFIGMYGLGFHVFFPTFIIEVDRATDCHLHYAPVSHSAGIKELHYVQPTFPHKASASATSAASLPPATIEPDDDDNNNASSNITYLSHWPRCPPTPSPAGIDLNTITPTAFTKSLKDMDREDLSKLLFHDTAPTGSSPPNDQPKCNALDCLICMEEKDLIALLHKLDSSPPPIRPCDTPNPSDTKSHWTAKELHRITGCQQFWNYKHLVAVSKDGIYIDNGKFPTSIGAYTTIPKAPRGKAIDCTSSKYLDMVRLDITFGDCMSDGGFKYALIFVDGATRYNWCFGLKSLHHNDILSAFLAF
jgi:hypothetical protein